MNTSLKEKIAAATKSAPKLMPVPSLGMDVHIRKVPAGVADELQVSVLDANGKVDVSKLKGYRSTVIATCVCDENSTPLFTSEEVSEWDNVIVVELMSVINSINKLDTVSQEELGNG